jgi:hypothetical protein
MTEERRSRTVAHREERSGADSRHLWAGTGSSELEARLRASDIPVNLSVW